LYVDVTYNDFSLLHEIKKFFSGIFEMKDICKSKLCDKNKNILKQI